MAVRSYMLGLFFIAAVLVSSAAMTEEPLVIHAGGAGSIRYPTTERSSTQASRRTATGADQRAAAGSDTRSAGAADERRTGTSARLSSTDASRRYGSMPASCRVPSDGPVKCGEPTSIDALQPALTCAP